MSTPALHPVDPVHPLPLVFDLVTSLLVPHIRRRLQRSMWPVDKLIDPRSTAEGGGRRVRVFKQDVDKVAGALQDIQAQPEAPGTPLTVSLLEYFVEVAFQRFFAWSVWRAERWSRGQEEESDQRERDESRKEGFQYRNGAANARAVLAMPLLCDLYHRMSVYIQQGNFGYMAAKSRGEQLWIYPHLDHYLANIYHPWIPLEPIEPQGAVPKSVNWERALERCTRRSRLVAGEMWQVLRGGKHLWERAGNGRLTFGEIDDLFVVGRDRSVSPFVRHTVMSSRLGLGSLWASVQAREEVIDATFQRLSERVSGRRETHDLPGQQSRRDVWGGFGYKDNKEWEGQLAQELQVLWDDTSDRVSQWAGAFLNYRVNTSAVILDELVRETDGHLRDKSGEATQALNAFVSAAQPDASRPDTTGANSPFIQFLRWRLVEEGLRLLADRLFLYRRYADSQITRPAELSRFHDRGMVVALVPEIHLNLCLDDQLTQPCLPIQCAWPDADRAGGCSPVPEPGKKEHCRVGPEGESPSAKLAREAREQECADWIRVAQTEYSDRAKLSRFWLDGRYPCHALFETLLIGDRTNQSPNDFLMARTLAFLITAPDESNPAAAVEPTATQAARFFKWLGEASENPAKSTIKEFINSPLKGVEGRLRWWGWGTTVPEDYKQDPTSARPRVGLNGWLWLWETLKVVFGVTDPEQLSRVTLDELIKARWPMPQNESELDRWGRHFFALTSFRSINLAIFRTLGSFGASESLINVRLLAPERAAEDNDVEKLQDYADFIGSFAAPVKAPTVTGKALSRGFWRTPEKWLPDLIRLKILVRILGTSLLNMVRTREWRKIGRDEERSGLRDLVRTLLHGYQKTASNFPQLIRDVTELPDAKEREDWGQFVRYVVSGHSARMVSVDAGSRRLMERDNPEGLFLRSKKAVIPPKRSSKWTRFLNVVAHGCLLGYVSRLVAAGLGPEVRAQISSDDLQWLIDHLKLTAYDSTARTRAEHREVFDRMAEGFGHVGSGSPRIPAVEVTGELNLAGNCWLVIPEGLERYVGNCWSLVFAELMDDMLKAETATARQIHLAFSPEIGQVEMIWHTAGVRMDGLGSLKQFVEKANTEGKWRAPMRPGTEASGGWGHYGNHRFIADTMGSEVVGGAEPQRYDLRWQRSADSPDRIDLDTRIILTSPSIAYGR